MKYIIKVLEIIDIQEFRVKIPKQEIKLPVCGIYQNYLSYELFYLKLCHH